MWVWFLGKNRGAILLQKVEHLQSLPASRDLISQFYSFLGVLDSKATGLLTVDAVVAAISLAYLGSQNAIQQVLTRTDMAHVTRVEKILKYQVLFIVASALLCLLVVSVGWSMLAKLPAKPCAHDDCAEELRWLANVVDDRTHYYWIAWAFTMFAFLLTLAWWSWWIWGVVLAFVLLWTYVRR